MNEMEISCKKKVDGEVRIPSSKSYAQRAIALAGLNQSTTQIENVVYSADVIAALSILKNLGATMNAFENKVEMLSGINLENQDKISINCNESGLSTRMFSAFSLLYNQDFKVDGKGSITQRTMEMVIDGLGSFGKEVESKEEKLPLTISGKTNQHQIEIDGSVSSQFLTGLLIVAPFLETDTTIIVHQLKSKPYIQMTLDLMQRFGLEVAHKNLASFRIKGNQKIENPVEYMVEGDWSAASFMVVAGAIGGRMNLTGLKQNTQQGDSAILKAVESAGAKVNWNDGVLTVEKKDHQAFCFDATECPDLFPPLAVLAAYADGKSTIKGVHRLTHKESNRGITLQKEFSKIGIKIELLGDEMIIYGKGKPQIKEQITFSSHNDHRIAMAMSLFSIGAKNAIFIEDAKAIEKSYPAFYIDFLTI